MIFIQSDYLIHSFLRSLAPALAFANFIWITPFLYNEIGNVQHGEGGRISNRGLTMRGL